MKLAILHYHLNRGGVTRVIANHLLALDEILDGSEPWEVALVYGGRQADWPADLAGRLRSIRLSLHAVPAMDYDEVQPWSRAGESWPGPWPLLDELLALLNRLKFTPEETVLHVHNHALGKNAALPQVVTMLGHDYPCLLQIHDFAEDFRPANYRRFRDCWGRDPAEDPDGGLYPQAPQIHYAALNGRDLETLRAAGMNPGRVHLLPNPVPPMGDLPPKDTARLKLHERFGTDPASRFVLYPVRGIRRKNVGEALLLAAVAPPDTVVGMTLAPINPAERQFYDGWKVLAAELGLPFHFELGARGGLEFAENMAAADTVLTTSVAEGFGMVFLESWLARRPLVGRDLPEITNDYVEAGLVLPWLKPRLSVPISWVGEDDFRRRVGDAYSRVLAAYGLPQRDPVEMDWELKLKCPEGMVDFGDLDEPLQEKVIRRVRGSEADRKTLADCNPWLADIFAVDPEHAAGAIAGNSAAIEAQFSPAATGRRLAGIYRNILEAPVRMSPVSLTFPGRILDRFLDVSRFRLIRS